MTTKNFVAVGIVFMLVLFAGWLYTAQKGLGEGIPPGGTGDISTTEQTISDGSITIGYDGGEWGLAVRPDQILVTSYIPPCGEDFNYCFYYRGNTYSGTNFDSAGLRVLKRNDLSTEEQCLSALPDGYTNMTPQIATSTTYKTSVFSQVGDAGAGHIASGALYRVAHSNLCYEFETRIGEAQFTNFPEGTIGEFTAANKQTLEGRLLNLLKSISLSNGAKPF